MVSPKGWGRMPANSPCVSAVLIHPLLECAGNLAPKAPRAQHKNHEQGAQHSSGSASASVSPSASHDSHPG
ncbi:unnamed protein product [Pleuronectes platessa]|uniref:Uncharacterized protein n=1 Tax=Pleuronectes platessa TaxID=8262 RepID=A0A9N7VJF9_PLEPL|nr:unnamed protein product [Pleuronectes platessa]